jgi:oligosaccharide repeat unit polymerase
MRRVVQLNSSLLSPLVLFSAAWVFAALLSQYHLLNAQFGWSIFMTAVVVAVPLSFIAGGLIGEGVALRVGGAVIRRSEPKAGTRTYRRVLVVFLLIGLLELAHQFAKIGGIPLLSPNGEALRFAQGGPTILLTNFLTVATIAALVKPRDLLARESRFELLIAAAALGGFALQAGRGSLVLPVIVAIAARWLYWGRPQVSLLGAGALFAFAAVVFGFYLRSRQNPFNPFEAELYGEVLPGTPFFLQPLVPIYLAITTNFLALQGVVGNFPTGADFGGGVFDAIGLDLIFSGARSVSDVSAAITPPWVTSTVAGPLWADGGFPVLVPGVALTGFFSAGAFAMAVRTRSLRWSMAAGYLLYQAIFGLYTNLWTQQLDWLMVVPLLLILGAVIEDPQAPPGLTGKAWERIRGMRARVGASAPATAPATDNGWLSEGESGRLTRGLVLGGLAIVAILIVSGLAIQRLLPEPYPELASKRLPASVVGALTVMTNSDRPSDNEPLVWARESGDAIDLYGYKPNRPLSETEHLARIPTPADPRKLGFDVNFWPPSRSTVLFSFEQRERNLSVRLSPTWRSDGVPREFTVPLVASLPGTERDFMIARWGGERADLFILTRGDPDSRPLLQILSGESGFRRQVYATRLPYRGMGGDTWAVDVTQIIGIDKKSEERIFRGDRVDLVLIRHDPDKEHSDVQVLLGETGFQWNAIRRDLDGPGSVPPGTDFMVGSYQGATAIYEVRPGGGTGPRLTMFGITNTPALQ